MPADRSAGGSGHGGGADLGGGEAVAGPLPVDVPARGVDRAVGGGQEGQGDLRHRPGHAQALLPRLLRPGEKRSIRSIVLFVLSGLSLPRFRFSPRFLHRYYKPVYR